jgi:hypothetical protein
VEVVIQLILNKRLQSGDSLILVYYCVASIRKILQEYNVATKPAMSKYHPKLKLAVSKYHPKLKLTFAHERKPRCPEDCDASLRGTSQEVRMQTERSPSLLTWCDVSVGRTLQEDNIAAVVGANKLFYTYFERGDAKGMGRLWAKGDYIGVVHPGANLISGRSDVSPARPFEMVTGACPSLSGAGPSGVCPLAASLCLKHQLLFLWRQLDQRLEFVRVTGRMRSKDGHVMEAVGVFSLAASFAFGIPITGFSSSLTSLISCGEVAK